MAKEKKGVRLEHISKIYQDPKTKKNFYAVKDTNLEIEPGSFVTLLGPSGCGKTTTLRMIAGFESPDEGEIYLGDEPINALTPNKRDTAMVFQSYALLPHYNIFDNVAYGLKIRKVPKDEIKRRVTDILALVGLEGMESRMTNQLSGGQQQRVAIARALATDPKVLLCDEATSALDPTTTASILELIRQINERTGITAILITHQMSVVESVCRHVAILDHGQVAETGAVSEVFAHPRSEAAKKLVYPDGESISATLVPNERVIRVVFNGSSASSTPLIAHMAVEKGIEANISYASTRTFEGREYGSMLLGIRQGENVLREAIEYLNQQPDVSAEEVVPDA